MNSLCKKAYLLGFLMVTHTALASTVVPQVPNQVELIKAAAVSSVSVPNLRQVVSDLADEVEVLRKKVADLEGAR